MSQRRGEAGFTLLELMISLGLFALIAVAGLALVDGIIKVQNRTEGRSDRLADLQRAMIVISTDLDQIAPGTMSGAGQDLSFSRAAPAVGGVAVPVRYSIANGNLVRQIGPQPQEVLTGIATLRWRFWDGVWVNTWPVDDKTRERWPRAVEVEMAVAGPGGAPGTLRRVVTLPARALEQGK
ncbi:type II secretion system protein GspJ [Sphingomonas soli]|uniref:type II secretion system protein GspJ n=1 Tax=Sphingomonas soli TaxID=266127 RepID=UPI00082B8ACF|nr:type II secretion system protein GspJ [Sphingomonas soli]